MEIFCRKHEDVFFAATDASLLLFANVVPFCCNFCSDECYCCDFDCFNLLFATVSNFGRNATIFHNKYTSQFLELLSDITNDCIFTYKNTVLKSNILQKIKVLKQANPQQVYMLTFRFPKRVVLLQVKGCPQTKPTHLY